MTNDLRGLILDIYKNQGRDWSNGGVSSRYDRVTVVGMIHYGNRADVIPFPKSSRVPFAPTDDAPAAVLVRRMLGGEPTYHVEPLVRPAGMVGFMAGGTYVATSDSRLRHLAFDLPYGALSFHDRCETPAQAAAYSD
jgi:hypothetical protein